MLAVMEHLASPQQVVDRAASLLRPGGVLVASVPTTPSVDINPHHCHDFTERSVRRMVARHELVEVDFLRQVQQVRILSVLLRREARMADMRSNLLGYYLRHPAALVRRLGATLRYGPSNRYVTIAWQKGPESASASAASG